MLVTLRKIKAYLKIDFDDEDTILTYLEGSAEKLVMDILRVDNLDDYKKDFHVKTAVMYATAYLYEHCEDADHHALTLTLRSLLFGNRREVF